MNRVSSSMPSLWIPNVNKSKHVYTVFQFSNFGYIPTKVTLWNHVPQFKNTARPVALLAHMRKFLLKMSITDFYVDFIFVEYLSDKVLIFCLCGSFGGNSLLIWTNLTYDSNSAIQGDCQLLLKLSITGFLCTHICWIFMLQGLDFFVWVIWKK